MNSPIATAEAFIDNPAGVSGTGIRLIATDGVFADTSEGGYLDIPLSTVAAMSNGTHTVYVARQGRRRQLGRDGQRDLHGRQDPADGVRGLGVTQPDPRRGHGQPDRHRRRPCPSEHGDQPGPSGGGVADPGAGNGTAMTVSGSGPTYTVSAVVPVADSPTRTTS